jgi:hypothetical protein
MEDNMINSIACSHLISKLVKPKLYIKQAGKSFVKKIIYNNNEEINV